MKSRRRISDLPRLDRQPIAVGAVCLALTQPFFAAREASCGPRQRWAVVALILPELGELRAAPTPPAGPRVTPADYCALIPSSLMIGHHFSASAFTSVPSTSGVCRSRGKASYPSSASRERTAGSASATTAAALSLPMMSFGVPLGAKSPFHGDHEIMGNPSSAK